MSTSIWTWILVDTHVYFYLTHWILCKNVIKYIMCFIFAIIGSCIYIYIYIYIYPHSQYWLLTEKAICLSLSLSLSLYIYIYILYRTKGALVDFLEYLVYTDTHCRFIHVILILLLTRLSFKPNMYTHKLDCYVCTVEIAPGATCALLKSNPDQNGGRFKFFFQMYFPDKNYNIMLSRFKFPWICCQCPK